MSLAAEAELGAACINTCKAMAVRIILQVLGYPKPCILIISNNTTTEGIQNSRIQQKQINVISMFMSTGAG